MISKLKVNTDSSIWEGPLSEAFSADDQSCCMWYEGMTSSRSPARKRSGRRVSFGMRFIDRHFSLHRIGANQYKPGIPKLLVRTVVRGREGVVTSEPQSACQ
jgi:hypothetical protein